MTSRGSSGSGASGVTLALVLCITLTGIMGNVLLTAVVPDIVRDFREPLSRAGLLMAVTTAPGILLAPVIGLLADRHGRRNVVVPCLALFGVAGGLASWAPSYDALLVLRFFQGVGSAGLINLAIALIGDTWSGTERARMIGRNAAGLTIAIVVLPPFGGWLGQVWGWRATFAPYWLGVVAAAVVWVRLPGSVRREGSLRDHLAAAAPALRSRAVSGPVVLGAVAFALIFGVFLTVVPLYLDRSFDLGPGARGMLLAVPGVSSTVTALNLARLRSKFRTSTLLSGAFAGFALGFVVMGAVSSLVALAVGALLYGAAEGVAIGTLQDAVSEAAPAASRGAIVAVWVGVARLGQTAGPMAAAAGVDGPGVTPTLLAAGALAAALSVAATWWLAEGKLAPRANT
ncbi:MAG TPA: MFS transporter [Acidimicrobiales bacterium]|nr:MFS transporter [Acidimicrobiales bacterium]